MDITVKHEHNVHIISLSGSLLADVQAKELLDNMNKLIDDGNKNFIFDLKDLQFINSSGLGLLLTCLTKSRKAGGDVILANVPDQVSNLLVITKLNNIFHNTGNLESALKKFS